MRHSSFSSASLLLLALGLSSGALACSAEATPADATSESEFTAPRVKEIMTADSLGLVSSTVDSTGRVHALVTTGASKLWYVTNAGSEWTTKEITSTTELLTNAGLNPSPGWVAIQQTAIAVDEDRKVSIAFELDTDASGKRLHTVMALAGINGASTPSPVIVAQGDFNYDLALDASRGRLHVAYSGTDPNGTKLDELQYRATVAGSSAFGPQISVACTGDGPGDWTTRKQLKIDHDASGRAHVFCAGGKTVSHAMELAPGSGQFGPGELLPTAEMNYPDHTMMGVAPDGTPHVTLLANGTLNAIHREPNGQWTSQGYFDESVGAPPLGPWEHPTYPMAAFAAQAIDREGKPVRVAVINQSTKDGMLQRQTLAYFGPDRARHDVAQMDVDNPVWNVSLNVNPTNNDAIVLFTTLGTTQKLWVVE